MSDIPDIPIDPSIPPLPDMEDVRELPKSNDLQSQLDRYRFSGLKPLRIRLDDGFEYEVSSNWGKDPSEPLWWHERATYDAGGLDGTNYLDSGGDVPIL